MFLNLQFTGENENNAQFLDRNVITDKWVTQFLNGFSHSGDSGIMDINNFPMICGGFGLQNFSRLTKYPKTVFKSFASFHISVEMSLAGK